MFILYMCIYIYIYIYIHIYVYMYRYGILHTTEHDITPRRAKEERCVWKVSVAEDDVL